MSESGMEILARIKAKSEKIANNGEQFNDLLSPTGVNLTNLNDKNNETLAGLLKDSDSGKGM